MRFFCLSLLLAACSADGPADTTDTNDTGFDSDNDTDPDTVSDDPVQDNQRASTGDFARDFIRDTTYDTLLIEIDYITGHAPDNGALTSMRSRLEDLLSKPGGITVLVDDAIPDQGSPAWTLSDTRDLEVTWRDNYREPDTGTAVLYMLYLDGQSSRDEGNNRILGYAYQGSSIVMFEETMASVSGGLLSGSVEPTVLLHEVGHQLGLVNVGTAMVTDHEDPDHNGHDVNDECIMFWQADTPNVTDMMLGGAPDFDDQCLNDIAAAGGLPR